MTIKSSSAWRADLARYPRWSLLLQPGLWAIGVYRFGNWSLKVRGPGGFLARIVYFQLYSIVRLVTGIDIPRTAMIGPGLMIHHFGGITINPMARIGSQCTMRQGLTIGTRVGAKDVPRIGNGVEFGAYAQVLGDVNVGDDAVIGALTLVMQDVPKGATVVGIPGRVVAVGREL